MADDFVTVEVKGLDELQRKLEELPEKLGRKWVRKALSEAGDLMRKAFASLAPKDTGFLAEHFNKKIRMERDALAGTAYVGPAGKIDYPAYASGAYRIKRTKNGKIRKFGRIAVATVARFLEFGTSKMAKKPFMTAAFESNRQAVVDKMASVLTEGLNDVS